MAKCDKKELVKNIRALNKLKLTSRVSTSGDPEDLKEDFITAIEKIDDDGKISKVPDDILDFYEEFIPDADSGGDDDGDGDFDPDELAEELEEMSLKEIKAFVKDNDLDVGRITAKNKDEKVDEIVEAMEEKAEAGGDDDGDDGGDDTDYEELLEEAEEIEDAKGLKAFIKDNDLDVSGRITAKNFDDKLDEVLELLEELAEGGGGSKGEDKDIEDMDKDELLEFAENNDISLTERMQTRFSEAQLRRTIKKKMDSASAKKDKATDKEETRDYPKGVRKNTAISALYDAIKDGGATVKEVATPMAKAKKKKPDQFYGVVIRNATRKLAKCCDVVLRPAKNGEDGSIRIELDD